LSSEVSARLRRITSIEVRGLFGQYDFDLPEQKGDLGDTVLGETVILYGDNGCGKTTLLKILYHLLSAANDRGHRSALHGLPFQSIKIILSDSTEVRAERVDGDLKSDLKLSIGYPKEGKEEISGLYSPRKGSAPGQVWSEPFQAKYISALKGLDLTLYYLADDRELFSDSLQRNSQPDAKRHRFSMERMLQLPTVTFGDVVITERPENALPQTLTTTHEWIRKQVIRASNLGAESANTVYLTILKRVAASKAATDAPSSRKTLESALKELSLQSRDFARFGFTPSLELDSMTTMLASADSRQQETMVAILEPYIDGVVARQESMAAIKTATAKLVDELNDYFSNGKRVEFDVSTGFTFVDAQRRELSPEWLSSGEQHLVRLFCCTLISRESPSVFLVDEPELSLNIKWQRRLLKTLSSLADESTNQFIFATHSMEILSQHRSCVVPLVHNPTSEPSR